MKKGIALLISVLVLGVLLLSFVTVSTRGFLQETSTLTSLTFKKQADSLATACIETALYKIADNASYGGNETVAVGSQNCTIRPIIYNGQTWTIESEAGVSNVKSRLRIVISKLVPISIVSWEEVGSF
ncbi:MAG: hypothetical protein UT32_C0024G0006 [Parcubacteria group bacterium GW2011_GWC2_39_14]|nr:MAG: hypothetical protein UT32_C0024G0006 [Parcubacteria group bacterium GW2011_GWC2_39_14]